METKFNFKSQICTSREQSERLLALGLKKETADMAIEPDLESIYEAYYISAYPPSRRGIPAWSLHRLIEIAFKSIALLEGADEEDEIYFIAKKNPFESMLELFEWLIKEGYFNKEYLEE